MTTVWRWTARIGLAFVALLVLGALSLLVIVPRSDERPVRRAMRGHRCLRGLSVPLDILVKTREEVDRFGQVPTSLEAEILERGRVLYGRGEARIGPGLAAQGIA